MKKKILIVSFLAAAALILTGGILACLFYTGVLLFNNPSSAEYPIRGVDVLSLIHISEPTRRS